MLVHLWEDHHGDGRLALWCPAPAGAQAELVEREPERFFIPRYVGHRGWIGVDLRVDVDWNEIDQILRETYRTAAPKTLARLLDADT